MLVPKGGILNATEFEAKTRVCQEPNGRLFLGTVLFDKQGQALRSNVELPTLLATGLSLPEVWESCNAGLKAIFDEPVIELETI